MVPKTPARDAEAGASTPSDPIAVTIREACRITGLARSSVYREIAAGRIRAVKAGKRTLLPMSSLRKWLAELPASPASPKAA